MEDLRQAIAAAEQAQQAEPVARDAMALANEVRDAVIAEITKDNIVSITGAVIKRAKRIDLSVIVDRYAAQPPAVADNGCKFPLCQNEQYQKDLAEQLRRELYAGAPSVAVAVPELRAVRRAQDGMPSANYAEGYDHGWNDCVYEIRAMLAAAPQAAGPNDLKSVALKEAEDELCQIGMLLTEEGWDTFTIARTLDVVRIALYGGDGNGHGIEAFPAAVKALHDLRAEEAAQSAAQKGGAA